ncbi:MAG: DUF6473 family protein [Silicimonas sp.]|nr:DUF6473 family protein [Silicimonas sp.]
MKDRTTTAATLDYQYCTYEGCRLNFRGPPTALEDPYIAVLGGTEVFGRFVTRPFAALLQDTAGMPVANFGVAQAGLTLFAEEPWLLDVASRADVTVLQILGAQNMSNRMYSVHARRNDRFLAVSPRLRELYPMVDFADINFTGHLIETLEAEEDAFAQVVEELKWAWVQRMRRVTSLIQGDVVLLWMSERSPDERGADPHGAEPHFIDRQMLETLAAEVSGIVEIVTDASSSKLSEMVLVEEEEEAALQLPGPQDHLRTAEALGVEIDRLLGTGPLSQARSW